MSGTKKTNTKTASKAVDPNKPEFTDYAVGFDTSSRNVDIYLKDSIPQDALKIVGEFSADLIQGKLKGDDGFTGNGDGILVGKARQIIEELGVTDTGSFTYRDRAKETPNPSYVITPDERDRAVREGKNPADYQEEVAENIDAAAKKHDK